MNPVVYTELRLPKHHPCHKYTLSAESMGGHYYIRRVGIFWYADRHPDIGGENVYKSMTLDAIKRDITAEHERIVRSNIHR